MIHSKLCCFAFLVGIGTSFAETKTIRVPLINDARYSAPSTWQYTTSDPGAGWTAPEYNDAAWQTGIGGFGSGTPENGRINTDWSTQIIRLRHTFTVPNVPVQSLILSLKHDDDVEIYLNGKLVFKESGYTANYVDITVSSDFKAALKTGKNTLAIICANILRSSYIDAGLTLLSDFQATFLVGDARTSNPAVWSYTTAKPAVGWNKRGFDASAWSTGKGAFGAGATWATAWTDPEIWMRTTFTAAGPAPLYAISYYHDDDVEVYLNGTLVMHAPGWNPTYDEYPTSEISQLIVTGQNVMAVHCENLRSAQFVDAGLWTLDKAIGSKVLPRAQARAPGRGPPLLFEGNPSVADLRALPQSPGRLTVYGTNGRVRAAVPVGAGVRTLTLPASLGNGIFRYRWEFSGGDLQGPLVTFP